MALLGRLLIPLEGQLLVLGGAVALFVAAAQPVLRLLVALLGGGLQLGEAAV